MHFAERNSVCFSQIPHWYHSITRTHRINVVICVQSVTQKQFNLSLQNQFAIWIDASTLIIALIIMHILYLEFHINIWTHHFYMRKSGWKLSYFAWIAYRHRYFVQLIMHQSHSFILITHKTESNTLYVLWWGANSTQATEWRLCRISYE